MRPLVERLVDRGYRVVAPWMRGYRPTEIPTDGDYQVAALAADIVGLLDTLAWEQTLLIGHDWGAVAGYGAAAKVPRRIDQLVALSVPPPGLFLRNAARAPAQWGRSWYMMAFQVPGAPERWLSRDDFAGLERTWWAWTGGGDIPERAFEEVKRTFRQPGTLEAALGYYRALCPLRSRPPGGFVESWRLSHRPIAVPTLMFAGAEDPTVGLETFEGLDEIFEDRWQLEVFENGAHFIQLEEPDAIVDRTLEFAESR
ncbi:MAG: alpha/beta fold hydrolase, partial [Bradymonadaceae bacterium]